MVQDDNLTEIGQGYHALYHNIQVRRAYGFGVVSGGIVSPGSDGGVSVDVSGGQAVYNGIVAPIPSKTSLSLAAPNDNNPRKDIIAHNGDDIVAVTGEPNPLATAQSAATRFQTYQPAPPDATSQDMVVLAEVWVPPAAGTIGPDDINDLRTDPAIRTNEVQAELVEAGDIQSDTVETGRIATRHSLKTSRDNRGMADMQGGPGPLPAKDMNFEDLSRWTSDGTEADTDVVYRGSQSLNVTGNSYTIRYSPSSAFDMSGLDPTVAIKPEVTTNTMILRFEDSSGNNADFRKVFQSNHPDTWHRVDGTPLIDSGWDPTSITEILISLQDPFHIDSMRFVPKRFDRGKFFFSWDDGSAAQYTDYFEILDSYGFKSTVYVPPDDIGDPERMTDAQIQELVDHGWEVGGHLVEELTTISDEEQRRIIRDSKEKLLDRGYGDIVSFTYPGGSFDATTEEIMQEYYQLGLTAVISYSARGFTSAMSNPYYLNRRKFGSVGETQDAIDQAIRSKSVASYYAHTLDEISRAELDEICQYLDANSDQIDVVTPQDILPQYARGGL